MTGESWLERVFLPALPELAEEWMRLARGRGAGEGEGEPSDAREFLGAVARELERLAHVGRVAELGRVLRIVERLLEEADPVLEELLREAVLHPLAAAVGRGELKAVQVVPFLGRRGRAAFEEETGG